MNQCGRLAIEYAKQVKILASFGIAIGLRCSGQHFIATTINAKMDASLIPLFF
ncbi:hypothetical protein [Citrobacter freundii]|uniref:hypothetical protein n=1 Tax=Citrobacter freundii TaxID=546 RepID=UPI001BCD143C|nr:hypothetical protein [Citrobacter freundii]MEA8857105.1 hypothetical protein [Citrobacter freundii]